MKIGIVGAAGRMGQMCVRQVHDSQDSVVSGATEIAGHEALGCDVGEIAGVGNIGVPLSENAEEMVLGADAIIDFTSPSATAFFADLCSKKGTALITGTTGLDAKQEEKLADASKQAVIVRAPNMSVGVNLLLSLTERVARMLGDDFDIEIVEMHHRHKVDAPSGTALGLGEAAAAGRAVSLKNVKKSVRDGFTGPRTSGEIGFATLRGGDVIGDHTVVFAGAGERIELTHRAASRNIFAAGAVRAAMWSFRKPPGLYSMKSVLGLQN